MLYSCVIPSFVKFASQHKPSIPTTAYFLVAVSAAVWQINVSMEMTNEYHPCCNELLISSWTISFQTTAYSLFICSKEMAETQSTTAD